MHSGQAFRAIRTARGLTQDTLSTRSGVSTAGLRNLERWEACRSHLSTIEPVLRACADVKPLNDDELAKLAEVTGLAADVLATFNGPTRPANGSGELTRLESAVRALVDRVGEEAAALTIEQTIAVVDLGRGVWRSSSAPRSTAGGGVVHEVTERRMIQPRPEGR